MSHTSQIGACLSDLVAHVHALVTENETNDGPYKHLDHRLLEIRAATGAIVHHAEKIAEERARSEVEEGL